MFVVGKIVGTHGIRGEVKVKRITDFEERFYEGETVYYRDENKDIIALEIESFRVHKGLDLLRFKGYESINEVEDLKGITLEIKSNQLTDLAEDEYYYHEIIGCTVETIEGTVLGKVDSILSPGANDVWLVKAASDKEYLIPYIEQVVKQVDIDKKHIIIEVMEGLLD